MKEICPLLATEWSAGGQVCQKEDCQWWVKGREMCAVGALVELLARLIEKTREVGK